MFKILEVLPVCVLGVCYLFGFIVGIGIGIGIGMYWLGW